MTFQSQHIPSEAIRSDALDSGDNSEQASLVVDTKQQVDEIVHNATEFVDADLSAEMRDVDVKEENIDKFVHDGCGCQLTGGQPCSSYFAADCYRSVRSQMAEMTHTKLDLVVMGQIMAHIHNTPNTSTSKCHRKATGDIHSP